MNQTATTALPYSPEWVRPNVMSATFGITPEAARKYRDRGKWLEGEHWKYDPLRKVVYNPKAIDRWLAS
jgi:hypothetical protein